tara:strand:+ start:1311 stop:2180 length:870 start_codon:yes stop_codon:yes gene_type:complete
LNQNIKKEIKMTEKKDEIKSFNVHQRIHAVMEELAFVQKTGSLKFGNTDKGIPVATHDDVTKTIHPLLVKFRLTSLPSVETFEQVGNLTMVTITTRFTNIDDPSDFTEIKSLGFGADSQDKGPGKAVSYAVKYAYLKCLVLETGEDADLSTTAVRNGSTPNVQATPPQEQVKKESATLDQAEVKPVNSGGWGGEISEKQLKRLYAIAKTEGGIGESDVIKAFVQIKFGHDELAKIKKGTEYETVVEWCRNHKMLVEAADVDQVNDSAAEKLYTGGDHAAAQTWEEDIPF